MKKYLKVLVFSMVLLILLAACGKTARQDNYQQETSNHQEGSKSSSQPVPDQESDPEKGQGQKGQTQPGASPEVYGDRSFQVIAPAGVPTISIAKMMKEDQEIEGAKMVYESILATNALAPKLMSGEADFAVVPSNLAITVYNKGADYQYAGSTVWGILYLVSNDSAIKDWQDLKGKTIVLIGRGLTPDLTLRYIMAENGLNPDTDVNFEYVSGSTELGPMFISGKADIALLPEPMYTQVMTKKPDAQLVFDLQAEWKKIANGESYPQTAILIKTDLVDNYPVLAQNFLDKLAESVEFAKHDPQTTGLYMEEFNPNLKAGVITKAIANCNLEFKDALTAKEALETYYQRLMDFGPENIGGKMPDENFYYQK